MKDRDCAEKVLKDVKLDSVDDLYLSVGSLRFTPGYVIDLVFEDKKDVMDVYLDRISNFVNNNNNKINTGDILVAGSDDILVNIIFGIFCQVV